MPRVFPKPIQRGYLVQIKIEAADIVARIVCNVAELLFGKRMSRMNNLVAVGQRVKLGVLVRHDVAGKICAGNLFKQKPTPINRREVQNFCEGIFIARQEIFKRGIFPCEGQNIFRQ